ncbi:phosphotransferase [Nocardia lijiangensis]|uniref:phosphotransferase n=1 Tax=Nocardia lijiangensis TaxID=299618 RepID=UPI00082ADD21|nr:phosphotransferase [Nocardia lijiangensis]
MTSPTTRITADLPGLLAEIAHAYQLGDLTDWRVLSTGYEDCNIAAETSASGAVVIKVFGPTRPPGIAARTATLITAARRAGVRHPRLHHTRTGVHEFHLPGHQILVMDMVVGTTLYDHSRAPSDAELFAVLADAARIHSLALHPSPVADPWAVTNLNRLAAELSDVLDDEQRHHVTAAVDQLAAIDMAGLPHALIHGDLTKGNILIEPDGQVTLLDFAVAIRAPRIQELAMVAANLTHGDTDPLPQRADRIAELYSRTAVAPLDDRERTALTVFTRAAAAMEMLGALAEWHHHDNRNTETAFLIRLGLSGLRDFGTIS